MLLFKVLKVQTVLKVDICKQAYYFSDHLYRQSEFFKTDRVKGIFASKNQVVITQPS